MGRGGDNWREVIWKIASGRSGLFSCPKCDSFPSHWSKYEKQTAARRVASAVVESFHHKNVIEAFISWQLGVAVAVHSTDEWNLKIQNTFPLRWAGGVGKEKQPGGFEHTPICSTLQLIPQYFQPQRHVKGCSSSRRYWQELIKDFSLKRLCCKIIH